MEDVILSLQDIYKSFDSAEVVKGISIDINRGEFITLLGSSGCGKTTTLRIISGLETPDSGRVLLNGEDVTKLEPNKRDINTVFQNYALFPHMNVEANIGYSLKIKKRPKDEIKQEVKKMLDLVQLNGYEKRLPSELSGGQRQRVAIARSVINKPQILLLDEPLGALDLQLRRQMQNELKALQKKLGITFIYITQDQEEALNMSDRIAVMDKGEFIQTGTPSQIYDTPESSFVERFVGAANIIKGKVDKIERDLIHFKNENGAGCFAPKGYTFKEGMNVSLAIRGEQTNLGIELQVDNDKGCEGEGIKGEVLEKRFSGGMLHILVKLKNGEEFVCNRQGFDSNIHPGDKVKISWDPPVAAPVDVEVKHAE